MSEVLKKPVHLAILKPTHIQKLTQENKTPPTAYGLTTPTLQPLPAEKQAKPYEVYKLALPDATNIAKQANLQLRLRVLYDTLPALPESVKPPCESCKTSPCCVAFAVNITKEEYESGFYGDSAVELTPEIYSQLKNEFLSSVMLGAPPNTGKSSYYLDGKIGEKCPFLAENNSCSIYDVRPLTCRRYSCVGDPRITQEMRDGSAPVNLFTTYRGKFRDD